MAEMPTALVLVEVGTGVILYRNAAAARLGFAYGEEPAQVYDTTGARKEDVALPHAVAARGQPVAPEVLELRRAGHPPVWLLVRSHRLGPTCVLTFEDVSECHAAQAELRGALLARDELVSMASHELRSPVGALALALDQISRKATQAGAADLQKLASLGVRQVRRLTVLIGNLLDVSRLRAGCFELDRERTRLGHVVREACDALADQARAEGTSLEVVVETDGWGQWDVDRMHQVVINLVTNAIKYGDGSLVRVHLRAQSGMAHLAVQDGGPGIPLEERERIFQPFTRATARHRAQSLGLGLYIVHEIVHAHGGTIAVESRPGRTCFELRIPTEPQSP
ncbi:MAG TPA: HAMP domain-containing sensor histidine kinase [Kofleriaceae bacterium]|nr:HAMP domain-containing sensor histidine kinase [Kofleriaceae bacterium]